MDPGAIHPKLHLIRPPAQGQTGCNAWPIWSLPLAGQRLPSGRTNQPKLQLAPQTTAGPNHQAAGIPVRTVKRAPGVLTRRPRMAVGLLASPQGLEIPQRT